MQVGASECHHQSPDNLSWAPEFGRKIGSYLREVTFPSDQNTEWKPVAVVFVFAFSLVWSLILVSTVEFSETHCSLLTLVGWLYLSVV